MWVRQIPGDWTKFLVIGKNNYWWLALLIPGDWGGVPSPMFCACGPSKTFDRYKEGLCLVGPQALSHCDCGECGPSPSTATGQGVRSWRKLVWLVSLAVTLSDSGYRSVSPSLRALMSGKRLRLWVIASRARSLSDMYSTYTCLELLWSYVSSSLGTRCHYWQ